jgi:hypothetical protein
MPAQDQAERQKSLFNGAQQELPDFRSTLQILLSES